MIVQTLENIKLIVILPQALTEMSYNNTDLSNIRSRNGTKFYILGIYGGTDITTDFNHL